MQLALTGSDVNLHPWGEDRGVPGGTGALGQAQGWPEATESDCRSGQMRNSYFGSKAQRGLHPA